MTIANAPEAQPDFLSGDTEMGTLIRNFDWSKTPLGQPEKWPQSLKTAVSLILNSQHPMWIGWGREVTFLYNDAYLHVLGTAKHPWALGRPASEVWAEIWDVCGPLADKVFNEGRASYVDDVRLFMNRGDYFEEVYYSFSYSPIRDESGNVGGLFCPSNDVTAKTLNTRRLRTLSELAANALVEKTIKTACATAAATLAKNPDDIPFALLYLIDAEQSKAHLEQAVHMEPGAEPLTPAAVDLIAGRAENAVWPIARVFLSGQPETIEVRQFQSLPRGPADQPVAEAVVFPVAAGAYEKPLGILIAGVNPTRRLDPAYQAFFGLVASHVGAAIQNARLVEEERKRADMLAELDRAKTVFFSNVSHEFRTPLTLMLGPMEEMLNDAEPLRRPQRERLEIAHRNSLRLLKLVNSLLDFSRIEAGRMKASYAPVDLASLTADLASNFRSAMEAGGLELVVDCGALSAPVYVDREMWEKIVLNLLSNAFKFTLEGRVTVHMEERNGRAVLTVSDTGVGIPEAELPRLFERFHRVEGVKGRTYEGTGIGLALIQELVKLHGGSVEARSRLNEGSVFTVTLPFGSSHLPAERIASGQASSAARADAYTSEALSWVAQERLKYPGEELPAETPAEGPRSRIILADDNADMRAHVSHILGPQYDLATAANGREALKEARRERPDLILSDVMMPELDGFGLLREVREDAALREVPVILLSARAGEEARSEGLGAGADDYLTKPFSVRELRARVQTTLELQRIRREARRALEESERALRESENRFRFVNERAEIGYWDWDIPSDTLEWSPICKRLFGIPEDEEMSYQRFLAAIHPEDRTRVDEAVRGCLESAGAKDYDVEYRSQWPDGTAHWIRAKGSAVFEKGRPLRMAGIAVDIDAHMRDLEALRESEAQLRRANGDLEQFAYSASHDLQEPMRTVNIYSQLLAAGYKDKFDGQGLMFLDHIQRGASRMETLLRDLLAYTHTAKLEKSTAPVDAAEALAAVLADLTGAIQESGARVTAEQPLPAVPIHATHLQQLFQNLISNAIKYRRPDQAPSIRVTARRGNDHWRFGVSDNGIGIDREYRERIFGLFKRLHTSDQYAGTGIGLAICQRIVELYGGRIWVESEPGKGSTFYFIVPLNPA